MNNEPPKTLRQRVYLQALVRISKIHDEIASGSFPSIERLAEKIGINERTVKRDLSVLRDQLKAPIIYERRKKGFRYAEIGWTFRCLFSKCVKNNAKDSKSLKTLVHILPFFDFCDA